MATTEDTSSEDLAKLLLTLGDDERHDLCLIAFALTFANWSKKIVHDSDKRDMPACVSALMNHEESVDMYIAFERHMREVRASINPH